MASCLGRFGSCGALVCRATGFIGKSASKADKVLEGFGEINNVVRNSLKLASMHSSPSSEHQGGLTSGISICNDISGTITVGRAACKWVRLCSGEMIFCLRDDGTFDRDSEGKLKTKPVLSVASSVFSLASKTLSVACFGNQKSLWRLGKHASAIGLASDVTSMASTSFSLLSSAVQLRDIVREGRGDIGQRRSSVRSLTSSIIRDALDLTATPLESGMVNAGITGLTVGCSLSLLGSVLGVVNIILDD